MQNNIISEVLIDQIYQLILTLEKLQKVDYEKGYSEIGDIHDKNKFYSYRNHERIKRYFPFVDDNFDYSRVKSNLKSKKIIKTQHGTMVYRLLETFFEKFDFEGTARRLIRRDQYNQLWIINFTNIHLPLNEWLIEFISYNTEQLREFVLTLSESLPEIASRCANITNTLNLLQNNVKTIVLICYYVSPYKKITIENVLEAIEDLRK